jgi:hypothetical protein
LKVGSILPLFDEGQVTELVGMDFIDEDYYN